MSGWRVSVDTARCSGIGLCEALAPGTLEVGDDGHARVLDAGVGDSHLEQVEEAVRSCPTQSLSVERVSDQASSPR
ncbi:MAG: ferredoxin [Mycobacterium kyogaense]|uniref:ferredoxin n=1 Tax=Mycobacterium kyogaense TaxID=2212479 RepID=UPI002FF5610B